MSNLLNVPTKIRHIIILTILTIIGVTVRLKTRPCEKHSPSTVQSNELHLNTGTTIKNSKSKWFQECLNLSEDSIWKENSTFRHSNDWLYFPKTDEVLNQIEKLFDAGVPRHPELNNRKKEFITCAVVGNSDDLLQHSFGKLIDQHTYVMRFNKAVTRGYEEFVGSKTTHHFAYPKSSLEYYPEDIALVFVPFKISDLEWFTMALDKQTKQGTYLLSGAPKKVFCNHSSILLMRPEFLKYIHNSWLDGKDYPSTGFIGTVFAIHQCDQVNLFGFRANCHGKWLHYFEKPGIFSGSHSQHDDNREKRVLAKLEEEGIIRIFGTPP